MKKTRVIMIDAFKPSYLEHAPYLRSLSETNQHGGLNMGFGHWRGVQMLFTGKGEVIANFYRDKGELNYFKYFTWLGSLGPYGRWIIDVLFNLPRWLKGHEMFKTGNIPVSQLCKLDVSVGKHFAKSPDIDFQYFGELDSLGHKYGTKSTEIINAIKDIDSKISLMDFDLIFSDHGMINISDKISVPWTDDCFIDSDMARYWGSEEEMEKIKEELPMEKGEIIEWDKKYGDLIFLVNTGVLIYPDFWNKNEVKAMHGYDGDHTEMRAFYLLNKYGSKENLIVEELHDILNEIRNRK